MRSVLPAVLRATLLSFLLFSSVAILYATVMNDRTVESLADRSLESTALALSAATESALRAGEGGTDSEVQGIGFPPLKDLIASYFAQGGQILLCTPCIKGRNIAPETLVGSASLVAAARVVQECLEAKAVLNY